jgi:hypothetical protein
MTPLSFLLIAHLGSPVHCKPTHYVQVQLYYIKQVQLTLSSHLIRRLLRDTAKQELT